MHFYVDKAQKPNIVLDLNIITRYNFPGLNQFLLKKVHSMYQ